MRLSPFLLAAATAVVPPVAAAADAAWPTKSLRLVVPVAPGGSLDRYTRFIAQRLGDALGQTVLVDNRPGANGIIGADIVAKATADGYTILMGATPTMAINVTLYAGKMPYDPRKDFDGVSMVAKAPTVVAAHPSVPARSLKELVAYAKANPGKLNYATSGAGSGNHLAAEMLKHAAGIDIVHVPYNGGGPGLVALLAREVELIVTPPTILLPQAKAGRVRLLAVSSLQRSPAMPDVPTIAESGFPGFEATIWYCMVVPDGTPKTVLSRLHAALVPILRGDAFRAQLARDGATAQSSTPEETMTFVRAEIPKFADVIRRAGVTVR